MLRYNYFVKLVGRLKQLESVYEVGEKFQIKLIIKALSITTRIIIYI